MADFKKLRRNLPMPPTATEAWSRGLPVITTFLDGALEQAGPRVTVVTPQDAAALAAAIAATPRPPLPAEPIGAAQHATGWEPLTAGIEKLLVKTQGLSRGAVE